MNAVIVAFTLLAAGTAALAWWSDRFPPCVHPEWVDLGDGDAVCEVCSEVFHEPRTIVRERAHACARCGALCADKQRHHRWHQAVDTSATTLLPSDPKDSS